MGYKVPYEEPIFTHLFWLMRSAIILDCGVDKNEIGKTEEESKTQQERNLLKIQSVVFPSIFIPAVHL